MEWFLTTLRNGIFHKGVVVDYSNRIVEVYNDGELNNLECKWPFEWFDNFMEQDIIKHKQLDKFKYNLFIPLYVKADEASCLNTYEDIDSYIDNELNAFTICSWY